MSNVAWSAFWGGGWHVAGHRGNLNEFSQALRWRPVIVRMSDAQSAENLFAIGGRTSSRDMLVPILLLWSNTKPGGTTVP